MSKPYSDKRWWAGMAPIPSDCNFCIHDHGFGKCDKYPEGRPKAISRQSFPGTEGYNEEYCDMKELEKP